MRMHECVHACVEADASGYSLEKQGRMPAIGPSFFFVLTDSLLPESQDLTICASLEASPKVSSLEKLG